MYLIITRETLGERTGPEPTSRLPEGQAMHRRIVSPASTKLRLWRALSYKLWTGETDMETGNINLTLYILKFRIADPAI